MITNNVRQVKGLTKLISMQK